MNSSKRAAITTHILDTERGQPAAQVTIVLCRWYNEQLQTINQAVTNSDGRVEQWQQPLTIERGVYQLQFATAQYYADLGVASFYPSVVINFEITNTEQHYHVPLLLAAHGYSTYRGS